MTPNSNYELYWGDLHKHLTGPGTRTERIGETVRMARTHLDFTAVYCYPFEHYEQGTGLRVETTGDRPRFEGWWEEIEEQSRAHNDPGSFVTFPAYEWHGDRRRWGDHHVVYFEEGYPLDDESDVRDLVDALADRRAFLVPHHTSYRVGERGKDWSVHDPELSPVMEVYSTHGSSEGIETPVAMGFNRSMGPRTSGGSLRDGLDAGHRFGIVASNDGAGVPGSWNRGIAGVWATDLTREAIWEAIAARRTCGVTGDRIAVWWTLDGVPMGGVTGEEGPLAAAIEVDCPQPLDRIDVIHDGRVADTYTHQDACEVDADPPGVYRLLVEFGWGPTRDYGDFDDTDIRWEGTARVESGALRSVQPRFVGEGQSYDVDDGRCRFSLLTSRDAGDTELPETVTRHHRQGLVFEIEASTETTLHVDFDDRESLSVPFADAVERGHLFAYLNEGARRLEDAFGVPEEELGNVDRRYHVSPKVNVHRAAPEAACRASVTVDVPTESGDYVYVRVSQVDGQYAWASPVFVDAEAT